MIGAITLNPSIDQHITIKKLDDAIALFPFTGIPAERESMLPGPLSMAPGGLTDSLIQVFHRLSGAVLLGAPLFWLAYHQWERIPVSWCT
jgi:hypothetical protein